ncbi:MAG TPA: MBL fold metallo-hydrolase [Anaerolineae bacterium]|nr:MAG: metal-dependent hydrolase [Chloroflexi bacterium ADurb.Bin222]HOC21247.1 MBL fold metallo-hydrolase [Anaerolineae bacterium]HQM14199.1 MBL fold metallo-hydrolase [Anaerolineae bacterium]
MEITWYGLGCFRLVERSYPAVITDPFDEEASGYTLPRARAEIVTLSQPLEDPREISWPRFRGPTRTLASPGEYEIGGLFITAIPSYRDRQKGAERGENIIYTFDLGALTVCHLGELGHVPSQSRIEGLGTVHVLLIPVGVPDGLAPSMAAEVVSLIEPNIVIPMNYKTSDLRIERHPVSRFLKEMGVTNPETQSSLKVVAGAIPEETQIILLEPQKGNGA